MVETVIASDGIPALVIKPPFFRKTSLFQTLYQSIFNSAQTKITSKYKRIQGV
jgi:hypothetical protein